jgi:hypothetical protein
VKIPRGRATVKIVASESGDAKARRPARTPFAAFERLAQGVQAAVGMLFSEKIPSPACRFRVAERSTGFCLFSFTKASSEERNQDFGICSLS